MSEVEIESKPTLSPSRRPNLHIQTQFQGEESDASKSQVWLQYSQYNLKTPNNVKFPQQNISQYIEFSNNLLKQPGKSQYLESENQNSQYLALNDTTNKPTRSPSKHQIVSELEMSEEEKNGILGRQKREKQEAQEWDRVQIKDSFKSRSSYEERDIQLPKRKFVLDHVQQQAKPKDNSGCSSCSVM